MFTAQSEIKYRATKSSCLVTSPDSYQTVMLEYFFTGSSPWAPALGSRCHNLDDLT